MANNEIDLGLYSAEIVLDDSRFNTSMQNAEEHMDSMQNKSKGFGKIISASVVGAVTGLGASLLGVAGVGAKMASDLQSSLNNLQSQTGMTDDEMKGMGQSLQNIYDANFGDSFDDIADAMAQVKQNTGETGKALEDTTKNALMLRDTFDMDVNETTNTANSLMKQFGITSKQAFTLIAQGAQNGANKNGDLLDSLNEYAPQFKALGFSADQFTNVLIDGAKNGQFSIDKVGDAMKEFNLRAKDGSATTAQGFKALGLNVNDTEKAFAKGGTSAQQAFQKVIDGLSSIKDPVKQNTVGVDLFGSQFEDLQKNGVLAFKNIGTTANSTKDTLSQINSVKYDTIGQALEGVKRNFQTALIGPIQQDILPLLGELSTFINNHMPQIQKIISTTFSIVGTTIKTTVGIIQTLIDAFTNSNSSTNKNFTEIEKTIKTIIGTIKAIISDFVTLATSIWKKYGDDIVKYAQSSFQNISNIIEGALKIIQGIIQVVTGLITGNWKEVFKGLQNIASGAFQAIGGVIKQSLNTIKAIISSVLSIFGNLFSSAWKGIESKTSSFFSSIAQKIWSPISGAVDKVGGFINRIKGFFSGLKLKIPVPNLPKLPHFSLEWGSKTILGHKISYPTGLDVKWYAKGGYFDQPTLGVFGDAGPEMALPLIGKRMEPFATAVYQMLASKMKQNQVNNNQSSIGDMTFQFTINGNIEKSSAKNVADQVFSSIKNEWNKRGILT